MTDVELGTLREEIKILREFDDHRFAEAQARLDVRIDSHTTHHELEQQALKVALAANKDELQQLRVYLIALIDSNTRVGNERWINHNATHDLHSSSHDREHELAQLAIDKVAETNASHFEALNQARGRANDERLTFATRDQLEDKLAAVTTRLGLLERQGAANTGRDHGFNVVWVGVLGALGLMLGIGGIVISLVRG